MIETLTQLRRTLASRPPWRGSWFLFLWLLGSTALFAGNLQVDPAEDPTAGLARRDARIRGLELYLDAGVLKSDVRMTGAFVKEVREHIESGLPLTFTYTVELYKKKKHWFDRRLLHHKVETRVLRNNLAGRYELSRLVEGTEVARSTTKDESVMRAWMSQLNGHDLIPFSEIPFNEEESAALKNPGDKEPAKTKKKGKDAADEKKDEGPDPVRLFLRVKAKIKDEVVFFFIPWDFETAWMKLVLPLGEIKPGTPPSPPVPEPAKGDPAGVPGS